MRIQPVLAFAAAAVLSVAAHAEPSNIAAVTVSANAQANGAPVHLTPDEAAQMKSAFLLADGRVMKVSNQSARLFVELDGKREELVPVGATNFVARNSGTKVAFDQIPFAEEVVVGQVAR